MYKARGAVADVLAFSFPWKGKITQTKKQHTLARIRKDALTYPAKETKKTRGERVNKY